MQFVRTMTRRSVGGPIVWLLAMAIGGGYGFHARYPGLDPATFDSGVICHSGGVASESAPANDRQRDGQCDCCLGGFCFAGCAGPMLFGRTAAFAVQQLWYRPASDSTPVTDAPELRDFLNERRQQPRAPPA